MAIEPMPGTYALILFCASNARIQIGRLGMMQLQRGDYIYLGSASGPGGLRARMAHHHKPSPRPHWHIDYLRAHTQLQCIWFPNSRNPKHQVSLPEKRRSHIRRPGECRPRKTERNCARTPFRGRNPAKQQTS